MLPRLATAAFALHLLLLGAASVWEIRAGREAPAVRLAAAALVAFLVVWLLVLNGAFRAPE